MSEDEYEEREDREARIERQQIEEVFGLTGGELADEPWEPWIEKGEAPSTEMPIDHWRYEYNAWYFKQTTLRYWYEGTPEYAEEYARDFDHTYRTVIDTSIVYGSPDEVLHEKGTRWVKVAVYMNSGECECPNGQDWEGHDGSVVEGGEDDESCELCEADPGDEHGYIYIGDCAEVVYQAIPTCERCGGDMGEDEDGEKWCGCDHDYWPLEQGPREKYNDPETRSEYMFTEYAWYWHADGTYTYDRICKCETPTPHASRYLAYKCVTCGGAIGAKPKSRDMGES